MGVFLRKPVVVANWKMKGSKKSIRELLQVLFHNPPELQGLKIVICPPAVYLQETWNILQTLEMNGPHITLGGQNVYCESTGAFTGEISPDMLVDMGCQYVIIGHSERRQTFAETDALIARKWLAAYHAGLSLILCIGETLEERKAGVTFEVLKRQLAAVLEQVPKDSLAQGLIAYEPVWAIGTGVTATPAQVQEAHSYLRNWLSCQDSEIGKQIPLLYGGSVKANNVDGLFSVADVDGALVGGASWEAKEFLTICSSAIAKIAR